MTRYIRLIFFTFFMIAAVSMSAAQTTTQQPPVDSIEDAIRWDPEDFPQWARDMRRFDIIAFGSFPFAFLAAGIATDAIRWGRNDWNSYYAPWPFKGAGAYDPTTKEKTVTVLTAVGISLFIALADLAIVKLKRHSEKKRAERETRTDPIIRRDPPVKQKMDSAPKDGKP